jgi:hypothetical protein
MAFVMGAGAGASALRRWARLCWAAVRGLPGALKGYDLPLRAAGLTFYAVIAMVPVLVLSGWLGGEPPVAVPSAPGAARGLCRNGRAGRPGSREVKLTN